MSPDEWFGLGPALRQKLIAKEASTRQACRRADAAAAKLVKAKQEAKFRAHMAADTATNDECRSAEVSTSAQVVHLRRQLEFAERAEAKAHAAPQ